MNTAPRTPQQEPGSGRRGDAEATRAAILASARETFAARGYSGSSVRQIARGAGVDPSLINHYFGGKEALFQEATQVPFDPQQILDRLTTVDSVDALPGIIARTFVEIWEDPRSGPAMTALLRSALADPEHFGTLIDILLSTLLQPLAEYLEGLDPDERRLRLTLVTSHLMGTAITRRILHVEPLASVGPEELVALLLPVIRADLTRGAGVGLGGRRESSDDRRTNHEH